MANQKINSTTQEFVDLVDIINDIAFFKGGNACAVLEVSSVNFYLLTREEQDARIYEYMALLNSLSFFIQILIISKKINLTTYLKHLDERVTQEKNPKISYHLAMYRNFIKDLMKGEELLDKKTYIVIPFSSFELGPISDTKSSLKKGMVMHVQKTSEIITSKKLQVITQLQRMGLYARQLTTEELIATFYELLNQEIVNFNYQEGDIKNIVL